MKNKIELPKEDRTKWLEALRSGEYKQSHGVLYNESQNGYCCLGVYCHVKGVDNDSLLSESFPWSLDREIAEMYKISSALAPEYKQDLFSADEWANEKDKVLEQLDESTFSFFLANMNDSDKSFTEIADIIEETTIGV